MTPELNNNPEFDPQQKEKQQTVEQKFNKLQQKLVNFIIVSVPKDEAVVYKNVVLELQKSGSMSADQVEKQINRLIQVPYSLDQRSSVLQIIIYGWLIKKLQTSGASRLKETLLRKYFSLVNVQNSRDQRLQEVMSLYNLSNRAFKKGPFVPGDPLNESPANITLDKSFYSGADPNDVLPLGVQNSPFIPEEFRKLIKNADALQLVIIKIIGENIYNPLVNWYNKQSRGIQMAVYPSIPVCRKFFISTVKLFSAKNIAKAIRGKKNLTEKKAIIEKRFSETSLDFYDILRKSIGFTGAPILPFIKPKLEEGKNKSNEYIGALLNITGSVFDIAARDPRAMKQERAGKMPKPDCYLQNKLFLFALMQHKNSSGIQKYLIEFIAMTISNFKSDDELKIYIKGLEPSLRYLFLNTNMGRQIARSLPFSKTWERMTKAEKEEAFKTFYDLLSGAVLTQKEKNSSANKALTAMNSILLSSIAKLVDSKPDDQEKANLLLTASILLQNITSHLVSISGNKEKADQMIDKLVGIIKILKTRISNQDREQIAKTNPTLIAFLDNPDLIKISLKGAVTGVAKASPVIASFVNDTIKRIDNQSKYPLEDALKLKQQIKSMDDAYKLLETEKAGLEAKIKGKLLNSQVVINARKRIEEIKVAIINLQGRIRRYAEMLKQFHERGVSLKTLAELLKNTKNPEIIKSLLSLITSIETEELPAELRKRASSSAVLGEVLSITDKTNYLFIANNFTDQVIKFADVVLSKVPGSAAAFKVLVLNKIKTDAKFVLFRQNPKQFLANFQNKSLIKDEIISLFLESIKHSSNYKLFLNRTPNSDYIILAGKVDSIISKVS